MNKQFFELFDRIQADEPLKEQTQAYLKEEIQKQTNTIYRFSLKRIALVMTIALLIIGATFSGLYYMPSAYIDIDVNPSVAITVNRFGKVIKTNAYNNDGEMILQETNIKNKNYDETVNLLLQTMLEYGYMQSSEDLISVTLQTNNVQEEEKMLTNISTTINTVLSNHHINTSTEVSAIDAQTLKQAHSYNLSPARYTAIAELQELDENITFEECASHSLSELREETELHHEKNQTEASADETGSHH